VASGGAASNTTALSGGSLVLSSGGLADPTTIYTGGSGAVSSGGTDDRAQVSGGIQLDYGLASGVTIFAGSQLVERGCSGAPRTASELFGKVDVFLRSNWCFSKEAALGMGPWGSIHGEPCSTSRSGFQENLWSQTLSITV
jgi:autotransporter passenger strand-loop-strand repeat protein